MRKSHILGLSQILIIPIRSSTQLLTQKGVTRMFIMIVEKRFSCKVEHKGDEKKEQDWYALVACVLPFVPQVGTEVQGRRGRLKLTRVIYDSTDGTFYTRVINVLHPRPDAKTAAEKLVNDHEWDIAVEVTILDEAKKKLAQQAMSKLKSTILRARPFQIAGGVGLSMKGPVKLS